MSASAVLAARPVLSTQPSHATIRRAILLKRGETLLVQGYRGLPRKKKAALLELLADLIVSDARSGGAR